MRETRTVRRAALVRSAGWWFDGLLLAGIVALTVALARGHLLGLDLTVRDWVEAHRPEPAYWIARVVNFLGQGGWLLMPVAGALAVAVTVRTRSLRPLLVAGAAFVLTSFTIGPMKLWTDRAAPSAIVKSPFLSRSEAVQIFNDLPPGAYAESYPSGHVAAAIVWYGIIALLLAALLRAYRRPGLPPVAHWAIRVIPATLVFWATTYLGYHWLTDSVAGLLLGLLLNRLLARVPWDDVPLPALLRGVDCPAGLTAGPDHSSPAPA